MSRRKAPLIPDELLDQLLAGRDPGSALTAGCVLDQLKRAFAERALNAEMDHHLADEAAEGGGNRRNGYGRKTLLTATGKLPIAVPRDRLSTFDPQLIAKYRRRLPGFDDKIISMYARGLSVREIQGHLAELYGLDVSPDLVSAVTDAILEDIADWQNRPLETVYPLIFFDALRVKIRDEGTVRNKAVYLALGVRACGRKEILGLWIEQTEGAKFWLRVMNELKNRGVEDVLIAVVDGLKGFPEAITAVFPEAQVQTCIVGPLKKSPFRDSTWMIEIAGRRDAGTKGSAAAGAVRGRVAARTAARGSCPRAGGSRARFELAGRRGRRALCRRGRSAEHRPGGGGALDAGGLSARHRPRPPAAPRGAGEPRDPLVRRLRAARAVARPLLADSDPTTLGCRALPLHLRADGEGLPRGRHRPCPLRLAARGPRGKGEVVHADASLIRADVSWESLAVHHVDAVRRENGDEAANAEEDRSLRTSRKTGRYKKVCVTDPDATMATTGRNRRLEPSYKQHAVIDDVRGVVLDVEVTTGEVNEGELLLDRLDTVGATTGTKIEAVTADAGYAYAKIFSGLKQRSITAVIPAKAEPIRSPVPMRRFRYDAKHDVLKCPRGKKLRPGRRVKHGRFFTSRARDCRGCDLKHLCLSKGRSNKAVVLGDDYPALLRARRRRGRRGRWTDDDRKLYQRHRWRSEGYHGEAKTWHGLARAVRRGLENMRIQSYLTAAAVNLKRLAAAVFDLLGRWLAAAMIVRGCAGGSQHPTRTGRAIRLLVA